MKHLSFTVIQLSDGLREHTFESGEEELALNFYTGPVRVEIGDLRTEVPARKTLREAGPMVYVPAGCTVKLSAPDGPARITAAGALGKPGCPIMIRPEDAGRFSYGKDNWQRTVVTHIGKNVDAARLISGETCTLPGGWASCPPHKHDAFTAAEVPMDEIYYFQFEPAQGFGFMRVYTDEADPAPFDEAYPIRSGDTVLIPRGYHPLAAAPGYALSFTWVLAGEGRTYGAWTEDARHTWIKD